MCAKRRRPSVVCIYMLSPKHDEGMYNRTKDVPKDHCGRKEKGQDIILCRCCNVSKPNHSGHETHAALT